MIGPLPLNRLRKGFCPPKVIMVLGCSGLNAVGLGDSDCICITIVGIGCSGLMKLWVLIMVGVGGEGGDWVTPLSK